MHNSYARILGANNLYRKAIAQNDSERGCQKQNEILRVSHIDTVLKHAVWEHVSHAFRLTEVRRSNALHVPLYEYHASP